MTNDELKAAAGYKAPRQNTKLEAEGAEFLVLGHLLIEGVSCFKAYVNFPGYDLIATNAEKSRIAKIQVKSRWATDYDKSFPIKNYNCDFVVHVALNRGYRFGKKNSKADGIAVTLILHLSRRCYSESAKSKEQMGQDEYPKRA